jgi:octaprenyl-diphosphate synthase
MQLPANTNASETVPWVDIRPFRLIDSPLRQVRERIRWSLQTCSPACEVLPLYDHLAARNGKMIRPGLVLLMGQCLGSITDEHVQVAALVEMIHEATLLHDDVIDEGNTRRGAPTANSLWGNESAVLLGDFVLSRVFQMAARLEPRIAEVLASTAQRVCEGELRQIMQRRNWQLTEAEYIDIITDKSASFFSGSCRLGAMLAKAPQDRIEAACAYGLAAGVAFQIADDVLDVAGDETRMGKGSQSDFDNSKPTLAVIHLLETAGEPQRNQIHEMLRTPCESRARLAAMLASCGCLHYAREQAGRRAAEAIEALRPLPEGRAREALADLAQLMADRAT